MKIVHLVLSDSFAGIEQHVNELYPLTCLINLFLYAINLFHIILIRILKLL